MTFEKHIRPVSIATSRSLGILRKSSRVFHDRSLLVRCFRDFVMIILEYCSAVWCSAADTHLKLLDSVVIGACFLTGNICLSVTLLIVDRWQYCVCCIRMIVILSMQLFMVIYLCRMWKCWLHTMLWSLCTVNWCKKVRGAWLASSYCMGFQNFVVSNKISPLKEKNTWAPPRCRTSQYRTTFIFLSVSLYNDLC